MRLAGVLSRGVKDEGGVGEMRGNRIMLHIYRTQSELERAQELHNSQCASFYKTTAETLEDSFRLYEMAFSILESLH